jgi:pimeloyl-ACP methyl ester carboxylesterase
MSRQLTHPTLLLPGIVGGSLSLLPLQRALRKRGIAAHIWPAPPAMPKSIAHYALRVRASIASFRRKHPGLLTLIGYSLGGHIAVMALRDPEAASAVHQVIAFGTPFDGTWLARGSTFLGIPWLKSPAEIVPGSPLLETIRRVIRDPDRQWQIAIVNGSLDPLAPFPQKTVADHVELALDGPYLHTSLVTDRSLHAKIADLIKGRE